MLSFSPIFRQAELTMLDSILRCPAYNVGRVDGPRVEERKNDYLVRATAPGCSADNIKLTAKDNVLSIHAESSTALRRFSVHLGNDCDFENATASHIDGYLMVVVPKKEKQTATIKFDGTETEGDVYTLSLTAAGIAKSDLSLTVVDGTLRVTGQTERTGAAIDRRYRLPRDADVENASAKHVDGILSICIGKKPPAAPIALRVNKADGEDEEEDAEAAGKTETKGDDAEMTPEPAAAEDADVDKEGADEDAVMV